MIRVSVMFRVRIWERIMAMKRVRDSKDEGDGTFKGKVKEYGKGVGIMNRKSNIKGYKYNRVKVG